MLLSEAGCKPGSIPRLPEDANLRPLPICGRGYLYPVDSLKLPSVHFGRWDGRCPAPPPRATCLWRPHIRWARFSGACCSLATRSAAFRLQRELQTAPRKLPASCRPTRRRAQQPRIVPSSRAFSLLEGGMRSRQNGTRREFALILRLSQDLTVVSRRYALTGCYDGARTRSVRALLLSRLPGGVTRVPSGLTFDLESSFACCALGGFGLVRRGCLQAGAVPRPRSLIFSAAAR